MKFRIYTIYKPYKGPPVPSSCPEWAAYCIDPIPSAAVSTWAVGGITFSPIAMEGNTREDAIENLKQALKERLASLRKHHGLKITQEEIEVPLP